LNNEIRIEGLERKKVKRVFEGNKIESERMLWFFNGVEINEHEKDALLIF